MDVDARHLNGLIGKDRSNMLHLECHLVELRCGGDRLQRGARHLDASLSGKQQLVQHERHRSASRNHVVVVQKVFEELQGEQHVAHLTVVIF